MEQQQGTMKELLVEFRQSLEAGHKASDSIRRMLDGTDALMRRLKVGEPPPPGSVPGRPFDVTEYTEAAATIGDASKQLQTLVTMLKHDAPAATLLGDAMRGHGERLIDHLYKRVLEAFGVLFVAVLLIVLFRGCSWRIWHSGLQEEPLRGTRRANRGARTGARAMRSSSGRSYSRRRRSLGWRRGCGLEPVERPRSHRGGSPPWKRQMAPRVKRPCLRECLHARITVRHVDLQLDSWCPRLLPPLAPGSSQPCGYHRLPRLAQPALQRRDDAGLSCEVVCPFTQPTPQSSMRPSYQRWIQCAAALLVMLSLGAAAVFPRAASARLPRP